MKMEEGGEAMSDENNQDGFKVTDRRLDREEDGKQEEQTEAPQETSAPEQQAEQTPEKQEETETEEKQPTRDAPLPPINFNTFILSLHSTSLMAMGLVPEPYANQIQKDLEIAKQNIDLLKILKEKTKGNLTQEENQLMDSVLYDLRMKFIEQNKG